MSSEVTPHQIGRYEILSSLGKGGMGHVYRARLSGPGRASKPVALKLIHEHLSQQESFTRLFLEELRIAMALCHRNIVQTFDGGESDGRQYLVMELVPGLSLWEFLKRSPQDRLFPVDIALFITMEICAALDYGHNYQPEHTGHPGRVLHRDVSPTNILLSEQGDVKLTDYGVAKAAGSLAMTSPNLIKGKLPYMPPEQARGEECVQSDLFSLAAVLYQMLARRPIREQVTLEQVRDGKPDITSLAVLRPDLPASLSELVDQCLCTAADDRPKGAWAFREALAGELVELQHGPDLYGRMRSFFGNLTGQTQNEGTDSAANLARVMLERVQALPTASEARAERETFLGTKATVLARPNAERNRWRWGAVLAGALTTLGVTAALWFWTRAPDESPVDPSPTLVAETSSGDGSPADVQQTHRPDIQQTHRPQSSPIDEGVADNRSVQKPRPRAHPRTKRHRRGWLSLNAVPWAKVYINGVLRGETPIQKLALRTGRHRVRLVNPSLRLSTSFVVRIRANRTETRVINLRHGK